MNGRPGDRPYYTDGDRRIDQSWGSRTASEQLRALGRRKWYVLAIFASFLTLAIVHIFTMTPTYEATVLMQVESQTSSVLPYKDVAEPSSGSFDIRAELQTVSTKLRGRSLARRVVEKLKLDQNPEFNRSVRRGFPLDAIGAITRFARRPFASSSSDDPGARQGDSVGRLLAGLSITLVGDSRLISVSYRSPSPVLASQIVNTLSHEFIEETMETKFKAILRAQDFLERQLQGVWGNLKKSEDQLLAYVQANNITNLRERQSMSRKKLAELSDELMAAQSDLIRKESRYDVSRSVGADGLPESLKTAAMLDLEAQVLKLEQELVTSQNNFGSEWPEVERYRVGREQLRKQLAEEKQSVLDGINEERLLAVDRLARLSRALDEQQRAVDDLDQESLQYSIYSREVDTNKQLHDGLLQRLKEVSITAGLRSSNILIVENAFTPSAPAWPKKVQLLAAATFLGLFLGIGVALILDNVDDTIRTPADVGPRLGLTLMGHAPRLAQPNGAKRLGGAREKPDPSPLIAYDANREYQTNDWEAYLSFRTAVLLSNPEHPLSVILCTSARPGEGKTTTAINLAIALAQTGQPSVLLDLDLRRPQMAELLGVGSERGMTDYLTGSRALADEIQETRFPDLHFVPAGSIVSHPVELLGSERMKEGLRQLRQRFGYVIIDTPPSLELSDTCVLSPDVDGVILVARSSKTSRAELLITAERISNVGGNVLGVFLNDVKKNPYSYNPYEPRASQVRS